MHVWLSASHTVKTSLSIKVQDKKKKHCCCSAWVQPWHCTPLSEHRRCVFLGKPFQLQWQQGLWCIHIALLSCFCTCRFMCKHEGKKGKKRGEIELILWILRPSGKSKIPSVKIYLSSQKKAKESRAWGCEQKIVKKIYLCTAIQPKCEGATVSFLEIRAKNKTVNRALFSQDNKIIEQEMLFSFKGPHTWDYESNPVIQCYSASGNTVRSIP